MVSFDTMWSDPGQDAEAIAWGTSGMGRDDQIRQRERLLNFTRLFDEPMQSGLDSASDATFVAWPDQSDLRPGQPIQRNTRHPTH